MNGFSQDGNRFQLSREHGRFSVKFVNRPILAMDNDRSVNRRRPACLRARTHRTPLAWSMASRATGFLPVAWNRSAVVTPRKRPTVAINAECREGKTSGECRYDLNQLQEFFDVSRAGRLS